MTDILIDTHLHLDFNQFDSDRDALLERAAEAGVGVLLTIGIDLKTCRNAVALAEKHHHVFASVGIHPTSSTEWGERADKVLRDYAQHPKVVAIGEIGLDYYWKKVPHDVQQKAFEAQLAIAAENELPVIIHDRDAHADTQRTLLRWVRSNDITGAPGVLHCFAGDMAMARAVLDEGFYLGVDGPITYKKNQEYQQMVAQLPLDRLLVETDAPFLTPHPYRGKRNEPAYVRYVAEEIARLHNTTLDRVAAQTTANAKTLFRRLVVS